MARRRAVESPSLLALLSSLMLLSLPAAAFTPIEKRPSQRPWRPARETSLAELQQKVAIYDGAAASAPTAAPTAPPSQQHYGQRPGRFGAVDLLRGRDVSFSMGTDTCGFISGYSSAPVTCVRQNAYCTNDGISHLDCCTGDYSDCIPTMYTTCFGFSESSAGSCSSTGKATLCCWDESPSCYSLIYSTSASPGRSFTLLQCQTYESIDTLLATPPAATRTTSSPSSSSSTPSSTSSTTPPPTSPAAASSGSDTPVGAIVGGVIGGIAVIALLVFAAIFMIQRSRRRGYAAPVQQPPPQQPTPVMGAYSPNPQQAAYAVPGGATLYDGAGAAKQEYFGGNGGNGGGYVSPTNTTSVSPAPMGAGYAVPQQQQHMQGYQYQQQHVPGVEDYRAQAVVPMQQPQGQPMYPGQPQAHPQAQPQGQVYAAELPSVPGVGQHGNPAQLG